MPIKEKKRIMDLRNQLSKGNHESASGKNATILTTKLAKEVKKGWWILILPNRAIDIPNLEIFLLGLAHQAIIKNHGKIINKDRVNHDLSLPGIVLGNFH